MTLRAANGSSAAAIAGHVTMAMAAVAGFTPLRAERARASLAQALGACTGAVELGLTGVMRAPNDVVAAGPDRSYADMIHYLTWEEALGHRT